VTDQIFVGVDVAKDWLDIHHASHGASRINNSPAAARSFAARCAKEGAWVVFEASGG
jgi:transposase